MSNTETSTTSTPTRKPATRARKTRGGNANAKDRRGIPAGGGNISAANAQLLQDLNGFDRIVNRFCGKYPDRSTFETAINEVQGYARQLWQQARGQKTMAAGQGAAI